MLEQAGDRAGLGLILVPAGITDEAVDRDKSVGAGEQRALMRKERGGGARFIFLR